MGKSSCSFLGVKSKGPSDLYKSYRAKAMGGPDR